MPVKIKERDMNYEELLESRNGAAMAKESLPFGQLYKKMVDGKYVNVLDLKDELKDSLVFCDAFGTESEQNSHLAHKNQLHFTLATDSAGLYGANVEQGNYRTFERLLEENPAVVAGKDFILGTIRSLLDITSYLHDQGIFHICYAPSNILARKGDNVPMLLFHGSAYRAVNDQQELYGERAAEYLAPEVIENNTFDARADIYSIGKFMEFLYRQAEIPLELKGVIKKATDPDPDKRYQSPEEMLKSMKSRQSARQSILSFVAAIAISGIILGLYLYLTPEPEEIEFVKAAPSQPQEELLDDSMNIMEGLGYAGDTAVEHVDEKKMREYQAKAEQIFRKNYTRAAEGILSKIYTDEQMNSTEKNFMSGNQATMEELVKQQVQMGTEAGLSESRSQLIAGEIIEQVTNKMKSRLKKKKSESDDDKKSTKNIKENKK